MKRLGAVKDVAPEEGATRNVHRDLRCIGRNIKRGLADALLHAFDECVRAHGHVRNEIDERAATK